MALLFPRASKSEPSSQVESSPSKDVYFDPIDFQTYSFFPYQRGVLWYLGFAIILSVVTFISLKISAVAIGAFFVFVSGLYLATNQSQPEVVKVSITPETISINDKSTQLKSFNSFWLEAHAETYGFIHFYKKGEFWSHKSVIYLNIPTLELDQKLSQVLAPNNSSFSHGLVLLSHILKI